MPNVKQRLATISRQIENVLVAQAMMKDIPNEHIMPGLSDWTEYRKGEHEGQYVREETALTEMHCGAAACFGGWCAVHPHFRKQGVTRDGCGAPIIKQGSGERWGPTVSLELFGDSEMFDSMFMAVDSDTTERGEINRRLKRALQTLLEEQARLERKARFEEHIKLPGVRMPYTLVDNEDKAGRIPGDVGYQGPGK